MGTTSLDAIVCKVPSSVAPAPKIPIPGTGVGVGGLGVAVGMWVDVGDNTGGVGSAANVGVETGAIVTPLYGHLFCVPMIVARYREDWGFEPDWMR